MTSITAQWRALQAIETANVLSVRLLGTFTLDTLTPPLGVALARLGIAPTITVGPFNTIVQECLDPRSATAVVAADVLVVWPRLEDLWGAPVSVPATNQVRQRLAHGIDDIADAVLRRGGTRVVVLPAVPPDRPLGAGDANSPNSVLELATEARARLRQRLAGADGVTLCDADEFVRAVGERFAYDHRLAYLAAMPYSAGLLTEAGNGLARAIKLTALPTVKVVVIDGDGTLWGGAVGEVGVEGVRLGPGPTAGYLDFQRFLLGLRDSGVLLALCSKNIEQDVLSVFARPDMVLRLEHLSAWRIGWLPKHVALVELAAELNVAVDSMVLVDDSLVEVAQAAAVLPTLTTVRMPADPSQWRDVAADPAFDRLPANDDDRARAARVEHDRRRSQVRQTLTPEGYLRRLGVWATCGRPSATELPRLAQLVLRTNQMNLNGDRPSQSQLAELCSSPSHEVRVIEAGDRYGDYGLVGLFILEITAEQANLKLFLLSCRALGRCVERMMLAEVFDVARSRGVEQVAAVVTELTRNEPARALFREFGCTKPGQAARLIPVARPPYVQTRVPEERHG